MTGHETISSSNLPATDNGNSRTSLSRAMDEDIFIENPQELADEMKKASNHMVNLLMVSRPTSRYGVDYSDAMSAYLIKDSGWISRLQNTSELLLRYVRYAHTAGTSIPNPKPSQFTDAFIEQDYLEIFTPSYYEKPDGKRPVTVYSAFDFIVYAGITTNPQSHRLLDRFTKNLTQALNTNPYLFWQGIRGFGLDLLLPTFRLMSEEQKHTVSEMLGVWKKENTESAGGIEVFCRALELAGVETQPSNGEEIVQHWSRMIQLLPDLQQYADETIQDGVPQRPAYYMQICYAFNELARIRHTEPVSALVHDKHGLILGAAHNIEIKHPRYMHAEEIVTTKATGTLGDDMLEECSIYISAEPCSKCATLIREYRFEAVYAGVATNQGGETKFGILSSGDLTRQGDPYGSPPQIHIGVLEEKFRTFYRNTLGWIDFVDDAP